MQTLTRLLPRAGEACVFAAACTGTARLSGTIGLPVVHIAASLDVARSLAALNAAEHGAGVPWPMSFQALYFESGWSDWNLFDLEGSLSGAPCPPCGSRFEGGTIVVPLPHGGTCAEFGESLAGALRHLRFDEAVRRYEWLEARSDALQELAVSSRYTPGPGSQPDGSRLVTDLYSINPAEDAQRILWLAVAARLAMTPGARPRWR